MGSRRWGLIAVAAVVIGAILLGVTLIWGRGPQADVPAQDWPTAVIEETSSPLPVVTPTPTGPLTYTVQSGDTLSALAEQHDVSIEALVAANNLINPDVLQVGQVLIIPDNEIEELPPADSTLTAVSSPSPDEESHQALPTLTPSGPALIQISGVTGAGNLQVETVTVTNEGGTVSLEGWTLAGQPDDPFTFPALTLFPGGSVQVHSGAGENAARDLYWGRAEPAWQKGTLLTLRDADGNVVDTYIVPD